MERYKPPKKSPLIAACLSILPGGGQFYTENYLKGAAFFVLQSTLLGFTIFEHIKAKNAKSQENWIDYEEHSEKRSDFLWWDFLVWSFSIGDAYVSAHFYKFKEQGKIEIGFKF
ncbi:hypothetical protein KAW65_08790 [candidate division WOR-3 bacterium]|nr:hypothetical protein [candidate division WOR-3 bacterium]